MECDSTIKKKKEILTFVTKWRILASACPIPGYCKNKNKTVSYPSVTH